MDKVHLWKESISQSSCLYNTLHKRCLSWALPLGQSTTVSIVTYVNIFWPVSIEIYSWSHLLEYFWRCPPSFDTSLSLWWFLCLLSMFVWGYSCPNILLLYGDLFWKLCRVRFGSLGQVVLLSGSWAICSDKMFYNYYINVCPWQVFRRSYETDWQESSTSSFYCLSTSLSYCWLEPVTHVFLSHFDCVTDVDPHPSNLFFSLLHFFVAEQTYDF